MAKDLPYFKFFVSEWNDGDITLEDYDVQGLFINLCSYYWSNECDLLFNKAKKKFKDAPEDLWHTILESNLIKDVDGYLVITFLDEQQDERLKQSKVKSKGGKASAESRKLKKLEAEKKQESNTSSTENQHVLNSCSTESQLLREEKIREDKKRKDNTTIEAEVDFLFVDGWIKEISKSQMYLEGLYRLHKLRKGTISELTLNFREHLKVYPKKHLNFSDFKKHFASWLQIKNSKGQLAQYQKETKGQL